MFNSGFREVEGDIEMVSFVTQRSHFQLTRRTPEMMEITTSLYPTRI